MLSLRRRRIFDNRKQIIIAGLAGARQQLLSDNNAHFTALVFDLFSLGYCPLVQLLDLFNRPFSLCPEFAVFAFNLGLVAVGEKSELRFRSVVSH